MLGLFIVLLIIVSGLMAWFLYMWLSTRCTGEGKACVNAKDYVERSKCAAGCPTGQSCFDPNTTCAPRSNVIDGVYWVENTAKNGTTKLRLGLKPGATVDKAYLQMTPASDTDTTQRWNVRAVVSSRTNAEWLQGSKPDLILLQDWLKVPGNRGTGVPPVLGYQLSTLGPDGKTYYAWLTDNLSKFNPVTLNGQQVVSLGIASTDATLWPAAVWTSVPVVTDAAKNVAVNLLSSLRVQQIYAQYAVPQAFGQSNSPTNARGVTLVIGAPFFSARDNGGSWSFLPTASR